MKITISSIVIGLKYSHFFFLFTCQIVIGKFIMEQFNKPITSKAVV